MAKFTLRRGHRWLALALLLPLLLLTVTGLLINHASDLSLDELFAGGFWLTLYGIEPAPPARAFRAGTHWLSAARGQLFIDAESAGKIDTLVGAATVSSLLAVADAGGLRLLTPDGRPVDRLPLPAGEGVIRAVSNADGQVLVRTGAGNILAANADLTDWAAYRGDWPQSVPAKSLPPTLADQIGHRLAAQTLSWERVLLDLHSGRLLGAAGPWLVDAFGLGLLALAVTGGGVWLRRISVPRPRRKR